MDLDHSSASPREKIKAFIFAAIAAFVLSFVFVVIQGCLAVYLVDAILAARSVLSNQAAVSVCVYAFGVLGSLLSASLVNVPLGMLTAYRPWLVGAFVGVAAALSLALVPMDAEHTAFTRSVAYVEYLSLIIFSSLAAVLGNRLRRRNKGKVAAN